MSLSYMVEAFHCRVGNATRKLILLKLADNADDTGYCFPSYQHIADQCECSKRVVIDHVKALVGQGLIKIVPRMGNRGQSSNGYQLLMDCRYKSRSAPKPDPSSTKLRGAESATPVDLTSEPSAPPSAEFAPPPSAESAPIISNSSETISEAAGAKHGTQLHHVVGSSARYDKIWIGQWWVLILRADLHDSKLEASYNVTDYKTEFEDRFGNQKSVFMRQFQRLIGAIALGDIKFDYKDLPPNSVIEAIQSYAR
jgi:hypothetical protein